MPRSIEDCTIDEEYRIQVNPEFETQSEILQRILIGRAGETLTMSTLNPDRNYLQRHNSTLKWMSG